MKWEKMVIAFAVLIIALSQKVTAQSSDDVRLNGFMTSAYSVSSAEEAYDQNRVSDKGNFFAYSRYGIQLSFKINPDINFTSQIIARGADDEEVFEVDTDWAYIQYRFSNAFSVSTGQIKSPVYLYSQTAEIGYTYPWIKPPQNIYTDTNVSLPGAEISYNTLLGEWTLEAGVAHTVNRWDRVGSIFYSVNNMANITLESENLLMTVSYSASNLDVSGELDLDGDGTAETSYAVEDVALVASDFGFIYDSDLILLIAEYMQLNFGKMNLLPPLVIQRAIILTNSFATIGLHLGPVTPHITAFQADYNIGDGDYSFTGHEGRIYGLRIELGKGACLKIERQDIYDPQSEYISDQHFLSETFEDDPGDTVNIYLVGLDVTF